MTTLSKSVVVISLLFVVGACSSPAHRSSTPAPSTRQPEAPLPVLGRVWGPGGQRGYGTVQPSTIFNGGDPTGLVADLHWKSWGQDQATGTGVSYYPHQSVADSTRESVSVVAFHLGQCKGVRSYLAIAWYFPQHGQKFEPGRYINTCTGDYVGSP